MSAVIQATSQHINEQQIANVLEFRYGDGLVYVPKNVSKQLYLLAKNLGFINPEGYLTGKGRALIARYSSI